MIGKIKTIKNLGIYKDYKVDSKLKNFNRYNLFYGWNGSGKTTISRLFKIIERKEIPNEYSDLKFEIEIGSQKYNEKNFMNNNENIFVFNEEFIRENINWDEKINKILLLSKDKIKEAKEYNSLKEELYGNIETQTKGLKEIYMEEHSELGKQLKELDDSYSKIAKNVKDIFKTVDPADKFYSSLNKLKIQTILNNNQKKEEIEKCDLEESEIDELVISIKADKRELIKKTSKSIEKNNFIALYTEIQKELNKIITAKVIDRLKENRDISNWVNQGLQLRKKYNNSVCEFCGNVINQDRVMLLEGHFNDEVSKSKKELEKKVEEIAIYNIDFLDVTIEKGLFYKEYEAKVEALNIKIKENIEEINKIINLIVEKITEKINNPFEQVTMDKIIDVEKIVDEYNKNIKLQQDYIDATNKKTMNFEIQIKNSKDILFNYYLKKQFELENIFDKKKQYDKCKEVLDSKDKILKEKEDRLSVLENTLSNETLGAEKFNDKLKAFIGYDELKLKFNKQLKGYEIIRKSTNNKALNLSEGEKTAIAFVYFLTKIKENNNKIENSIIIVDDPISSFDNNKLFNAYSSIKCELEKSKQLFILTHNFNFFKLIRDWINKKRDSNDDKIYSIYKIEPDIKNGIRIGNIKNAGKSLNQTSEYDYVFDCVYKYKDKELDENDIFNCGNACRKLLEAFLSFKFPCQRNDIRSLLDKAFKEKDEIQINNRVYKFINAYSHLNVIESTEMSEIDTLLVESKGIVNIILNKIQELDEEHYNAMVHNSVSTSEI